ncbi:LOW QUALITY PROTEIN: phenoloxidase 3 [Folsomia candida]|uniref:LOW QUALITY PROTEIN: phenoloxidase 3 n=1 Tax=Folsomia candida TaxID=158441 RepID=UPI001605030F|nr:LOW QUALITY PROTEIN: phenoloxidase 3 [Folsomia candida]
MADITNTNRERYYHLFTPKPYGPTPMLVVNQLYKCWNEQYNTAFDSITSKIGPTQMFASFHGPHAKAVGELAGILIENIDMEDPSNMQAIEFFDYIRRRGDIHPQLFVSALPMALVSTRSSLIGEPTPPLVEMFPSRFLPRVVEGPEIKLSAQSGRGTNKTCIKVDQHWGSTKTNGIENRLWYFREDLQLNSHHWNWHQFHPTHSPSPIPRRGELFYFFHHDLMARYASERMANGFTDYFVEGIKPIVDYELKQGYDANLRDGVSYLNWVNRVNSTFLNKTSLSSKLFSKLKQQEIIWNHIYQITQTDKVLDGSNDTVPLMPKPDGINTIGELFESSQWSINSYFYSDDGWHNNAHDILGKVLVEKDQSLKKEYGVLSDVATAVRDIYFYRIHNEVNNMFMRYKHKILNPYELSQGDHPYIVTNPKSIQVRDERGHLVNNLTTFWNNRDMVLNGGLDILPKPGDTDPLFLYVCLKHLDHQEFTYIIELENQDEKDRSVFVRLYMAPTYNPDRERFNLTEQYPLFFAMDAFPIMLSPGANTIHRKSADSTVTNPWFTLTSELPPTASLEILEKRVHAYPHHLLLPKGSDDNLGVYDLVAMVTDGSDYNGQPTDLCASSYMHCSRLDGNLEYPDTRPMGWPFDRRPSDELSQAYLDRLVQQVPNMAKTTVTIVHNDVEPKEHVI